MEKNITSTITYYIGRAKFKISSLINTSIAVHKSGKKHLLAQLKEIIYLRLGKTKMKPSEYFSQAIYDDEVFADSSLSEFGGYWFKESIHSQLNLIRWEGMATDKLTSYSLFTQYNLPHPKVHAIACNYQRYYGDVPVFHEPKALADFIRNSIPFPFFCKAIKGSYARGAARVEGYKKEMDCLVLSDSTEVKVDDFVHSLEDGDGWGFLFQDAVIASPLTLPICGQGVTGFRIVMLLDDDGAFPLKILWKIPAGNNFVDNFDDGKFGNMVANVDNRTGKVNRVVSGNGINRQLNQPHPDTGYDLAGSQVPMWEDLMSLMKRAAECFPGFRWQHWDVGLTSEGFVLYELNSAGNTDLVQASSGKGIYDDELKTFMSKYGGKKRPIGKLFPHSHSA